MDRDLLRSNIHLVRYCVDFALDHLGELRPNVRYELEDFQRALEADVSESETTGDST